MKMLFKQGSILFFSFLFFINLPAQEEIIICLGETVFLPAIQFFPIGPAGPNGESCTPLLTDIFIEPATATSAGTDGFVVSPSVTTTYSVISNGFFGAPGIGSCSNQLTETYIVIVEGCTEPTSVICLGESAFLPAVQSFPQGPAGPNGESCTPLLTDISISPNINAIADGTNGFTVSPTETTLYIVTSNGFTGAPGIGSCEDEALLEFIIEVDPNCNGSTENICLGGNVFLPALQNFPQGPAGPNGESCTPLLTDISISPNIDAFQLDNEGFYVSPTTTTTYTITSNGFTGAPGIGSCSDQLTETFTVVVDEECTGGDFSVFFGTFLLEGAYNNNTGEMDSDLGSLLPNNQPFSGAPYFYDGDEAFEDFSNLNNPVDWVLIEMRLGTPSLSGQNTVVVERQAGLLLASGDLLDTDGFLGLVFNKLVTGQEYHVVIRHRNHLDVMTNISIPASGEMIFDFINSPDQAFGPQQLVQLPNGSYALFAGDYNGDGVIQSTDNDLWAIQPAINNTYSNTDGNLDGIVQATDFDTWFPNKAKLGASEIQLD